MKDKNWMAIVKQEHNVASIVEQIGFDLKKRRFGPCPACKATTENHSRRPPCHIWKAGEGWTCNACKAQGDVIELVSLHLHETTSGQLKDWTQVKAFFGKSVEHKPYMLTEDEEKNLSFEASYPPMVEVIKTLDACPTIRDCEYTDDEDANLNSRGIEWDKLQDVYIPCVFDDYDSLTKVEHNGRQVSWWPRERTEKYQLMLPMYDHEGIIRSILGRTIEPDRKPKSIVPIGFSTKGLFLANEAALEFMKGDIIHDEIWIVEGEIDMLSIAQYGVPVIGIRSGSVRELKNMEWNQMINVIIATDADDAGDKYATQIADAVWPAKPFRVYFRLLNGGE